MRSVLSRFITIMALAVMTNTVYGDFVTVGERDWRQLNETTSKSYNQLDTIFDTTTGQLDTNITAIGEVNFEGWTWASITDVAEMYSTFGDLSLGPEGSYMSRTLYGPLSFFKSSTLQTMTVPPYGRMTPNG